MKFKSEELDKLPKKNFLLENWKKPQITITYLTEQEKSILDIEKILKNIKRYKTYKNMFKYSTYK